MDIGLDAQVLRDGDRVEAWGRLVRNADGVWFEPPLPRPAVLRVPDPVDPPWRGAVRVVGANLDDVENRREHEGAVEGYATLTGRWLRAGIGVERQTATRPARSDSMPGWDRPPCPSPEGGWPQGARDSNLEFDPGPLLGTGAAVGVTIFRPSPTQAVLVVAARDLPAVEARLRPQLGDRLCVVASRFTRDELEAAREALTARFDDWDIYQTGETSDGAGQPYIEANIVRILPEVAAWARSCPPGLVVIEPWLAPERRLPTDGS